MTMTAIIYARFSTLEQRKGTSIQRQLSECRAHCAAKGWAVSSELSDRGKSAFTGKHREADSALGQFEGEALDGIHSGIVLVVEKLDRLSRQTPMKAFAFVSQLMGAGVSISTADGRFWLPAGSEPDMGTILSAFIEMDVANRESVNKAARVRDAKARHRQAARETGRIFTKSGPPWLKAVEGRWERDDERVAVLESIFRMADEGAGKMTLARHMNSIDPKGWGTGKRAGKGWHPSFIVRLLSNRAVLGEYQPHECRDGKREPSGEPIPNYYPAVIDADLFERVNAQAGARKALSGGRKGAERVANLVSGLAKCGECGAPMRYRARAAEGVVRRVNGKAYVKPHADASLVCSAAERGLSGRCSNRAGIAYHTFEQTLLDSILHIALDDQAFSNRGEVGRLSKTIAERQRALSIAAAKAERLWSAWADEGSDVAMKLAKAAEAEAAELRSNLEALERQREQAKGRASSAEHLARVADIRANLYHADLSVRVPLRRKVAQAFQSVITSITCDAERVATIVLAGGLAALQIQRSKVIRQANAVRAFADGRFSSLVARNELNQSAIPAAMGRLTKALVEQGSLEPNWRERHAETLRRVSEV